jgi:membrane protein DedA with SNARE-associated domain
MESIIQSIQQADPTWAYILLFLSATIENIFPPIPGDTVTIFGAYLVGRGALNYWGVLISTTLGSILGFMGIFGIAYLIERKIIEKYQPKWVVRAHVDQIEQWFRKYGYWIILFNRFLSGVRSVISLVAGFSKMNPVKVFILAFISCLLWNGLLLYLGLLIGQNWDLILEYLKIYNKAVIIIITLILIIYYFYRRRKKNELPQ